MNSMGLGLRQSLPTSRDHDIRVELARRSREARRHRAQFVGPTIARDLPWDILMVLYTVGMGARLKVTSIQADVGAPQTTVLRWLQFLEDKDFIERHVNPSDRRIAFIGLSPRGRAKLDSYFDAAAAVEIAAI